MSQYFDSEKIQPKVEEYTRLYQTDRNKANDIFKEIYPDLIAVINGVIFTHKLHMYDDVDELQAVAMEALSGPSGLAKFNPNYTGFKGKKENLLFSYISLICKRSMSFYTLRNKRVRAIAPLPVVDTGDVDRNFIIYDDNFNTMSFIEESDKYIRKFFIDTRFYTCYDYLIKYIKINGRFNKRDFIHMVIKMLNTEDDIIPRVTTRTDKPNEKSRANTLIRRTLKLYKYHLNEYLKESNNGFTKLEKSTEQSR